MERRDGALLVDKPAGPTSHDVVARIRKLFRTGAVGHTGTLDPFATGLLILVLGAATRLARWAERRRKTYRATIRLGQVTTTDDRTGELLEDKSPEEWPALAAVRNALAGLTGPQRQRPPAYSAKLIGGVRSYRLARRPGPVPEPASVPVTVFRLEMLDYQPPLVTVEAEVSPGTYLRALGRDLGETLGIGAHVAELRREQIGTWRVEDAHPLGALTGTEPLLPPAELLAGLPRVALSPEEARAAQHGRDIARGRDGGGPDQPEAALYQGERLVGVGSWIATGWHPAVVLPEDDGNTP